MLERMRNEVSKDLYEKMKGDSKNLQMVLLNDYLNGYSEKLVSSTLMDTTSIKIDKDNFEKITKQVSAGNYNPYTATEQLGQLLQAMALQPKDAKYLETVKKIKEDKEEKSMKRQIK